MEQQLTKPVFADGRCSIANVSIRLGTGSGERLHICDRVRELADGELKAFGAALGVEIVPGAPRDEAVHAVSSYVQMHWFLAVEGKIPDKIVENHDTRMVRYVKLLDQLKKGESPMAKGKKAVKKEKKAKEYQVVMYEAAKVDTEKGKKTLEAKTHNGEILRTLDKAGEPMSFEQLKKALGKLDSESKNPNSILRWHINDLKKKGLVKVNTAKVEAASAEEAKAEAAAA